MDGTVPVQRAHALSALRCGLLLEICRILQIDGS